MRGGVVTQRRRLRERSERMRRRALIAGLILLLGALAMSDPLRERIGEWMREGARAAATFAGQNTATIDVTLGEMEMVALQLGVFDSEERAKSEQMRLREAGIPCVIWQRDKLRLICGAASTKEALDQSLAGGNEAYIVRDTLQAVSLRIRCAADQTQEAAAFLSLPDETLKMLLAPELIKMETMLWDVQKKAEHALEAFPENALCMQLAQQLLDWCQLIRTEKDENSARCLAAISMCTICREWRNVLLASYSASAESTASAQRTPSTAADVMPPA